MASAYEIGAGAARDLCRDEDLVAAEARRPDGLADLLEGGGAIGSSHDIIYGARITANLRHAAVDIHVKAQTCCSASPYTNAVSTPRPPRANQLHPKSISTVGEAPVRERAYVEWFAIPLFIRGMSTPGAICTVNGDSAAASGSATKSERIIERIEHVRHVESSYFEQ